MVNDGPSGLARFCTLRSRLSQWSWDDARGDGVRCAADIAAPVLVIGDLADDTHTAWLEAHGLTEPARSPAA